MSETLDALNWLHRQPAARCLPLRRTTRDTIALRYLHWRSEGKSHADAKAYSVLPYGSAWVTVAWIALQVIWLLLQHWWNKRQG